MMTPKFNVCLITGNWAKNNYSIPLTCRKLIDAIKPNCKKICVIISNHELPGSGQNFKQFLIDYDSVSAKKNYIYFSFHFFLYQIKIIKKILFEKKIIKSDIFIFCFGADLQLIPICFLRLIGKKVIIRSDGISSLAFHNLPKKRLLITQIFEIWCYSLANIITTEVPQDFQKYPTLLNKVYDGNLFVENYFFSDTIKPLDKRRYTIGFIGRFSSEKNIISIIEAAILLQKFYGSYSIIFIGDGPLQIEAERLLEGTSLKYTLHPWLPREQIPIYLDDIKILIIPSEQEGLPNIIIEAMARGTLILTTKVGAIPDIIKNGVTGFILENTTPICIYKNLIKIINLSDVEQIMKNEINFVRDNFSLEKSIDRWNYVFEKFTQSRSR